MRRKYITPLLIFSSILFSAGVAKACRANVPLVTEADLKYAPTNMIAFKAVIKKISSNGDLNQGKPHGSFQLKLKITRLYQGANLGNTIIVDYGSCHDLPGKAGSLINVLALRGTGERQGWYAPQFWQKRATTLS